MKMTELKELAKKDLREKLENAEAAHSQMKLNHAVSPLENPSQIKITRHDIIHIKTELRQRELSK